MPSALSFSYIQKEQSLHCDRMILFSSVVSSELPMDASAPLHIRKYLICVEKLERSRFVTKLTLAHTYRGIVILATMIIRLDLDWVSWAVNRPDHF